MSDDLMFYSLGTGFAFTFIILFGLYMAGFGKIKSFLGAIFLGPTFTYVMMSILIMKAGGV